VLPPPPEDVPVPLVPPPPPEEVPVPLPDGRFVEIPVPVEGAEPELPDEVLGAESVGAGWLGVAWLGAGLTVPALPPPDLEPVLTLLPPRLATYVGVDRGAGVGAATWLG